MRDGLGIWNTSFLRCEGLEYNLHEVTCPAARDIHGTCDVRQDFSAERKSGGRAPIGASRKHHRSAADVDARSSSKHPGDTEHKDRGVRRDPADADHTVFQKAGFQYSGGSVLSPTLGHATVIVTVALRICSRQQ
jgi:hypothetical protein